MKGLLDVLRWMRVRRRRGWCCLLALEVAFTSRDGGVVWGICSVTGAPKEIQVVYRIRLPLIEESQ